LDSGSLLGGDLPIDYLAAERAVGQKLAGPLQVTVRTAAAAVIDVVNNAMAEALKIVSVQRGHDPREFALAAFGGAGPMHAMALAKEIGIPRVLVPRHPGNFSALGLLASQIKHDDVRTRVGLLRDRLAVALELFGEMEHAARHQLGLEGFSAQEQRLARSLDLRYRGQAFELNVAVAEPGATGLALEPLEAEFHRQHLGAYGHSSPGAPIELVNARLTAYGVVPRPAGERYRSASRSIDAALIERRAVWFAGAPSEAPVWERERLPEGAVFRGPAIVEEFGATTIVPPGWGGAVDEHGNLRFEREAMA
ncbi:MAG: hydantoinase/oxoprolinase family protein, partial [Candidatus Rokuibacteriota bacterium]